MAQPRYHLNRWLSWMFFTLAGVLYSGSLAAQADGHVSGLVSDSTGVPIYSAEVTITGWPYPIVTDESGAFAFSHVPLGAGTVSIRRLGFEPVSVKFTLKDATSPVRGLNVKLRRLPIFLQPVTIESKRVNYTGRLAGYYQRLEKKAGGYFITRAQIDAENPRTLSQLLQRVPAVSGSRMRGGGAGVRMRGRNCAPLVWLDSTPMPAGEVDLNAISPQTIQGIELYLGSTTAPARYTLNRDASSCGTIILWSRGPDTEPNRTNQKAVENLERLVASLTVFTSDKVEPKAQPAFPLSVAYPAALFAEGLPGSVVAEYVVDTLGRVEPGTFGIVSSTHPLFSSAVREAVESAVFIPAKKGALKVRQLVQQPFSFVPPRNGANR